MRLNLWARAFAGKRSTPPFRSRAGVSSKSRTTVQRSGRRGGLLSKLTGLSIAVSALGGLGLALPAMAVAEVPAVGSRSTPRDASELESPAPVLTLEEAIQVALLSNGDLLAARASLEQARARIISAGARPNPEVGGEFAPSVPGADDWSLFLALEQQIPTRYKIVKRVDLASTELERDAKLVQDLERMVVGAVRRTYRRAQLLEVRMELSRSLASLNQRLLRVARTRFAQGEVSELDVRQFEIALARRRQEVGSLAAIRRSASLGLARLLNRPAAAQPSLSAGIAGPTEAFPIEPFLEEAMDRAGLKALEKESEAGEKELLLRQAEIWSDPVLGLFSGVERARFDGAGPLAFSETDYFLGVRFKIAIPYRYKNQGEIAEAQARTRTAEAVASALKVDIDRQVRDAHQRALAQLEIIDALEEGINAADEANRLAEEAYSQGLINALQQMQTQQQLFDIRDAQLNAREEYYEALSDLEATVDPPRAQIRD